jgi:large subunit ribosomal protein L17
MRHRVAHRKLSRVTEHRLALLRNQAQALLRHERIHTTVAKAKELRPFVERLITIAKRGLANDGDETRALNARRMVRRDLADREVVTKLFETIAPRFESRPGGYTRLLRMGHRQGDDAEVAQVELIGSEYDPSLEVSPDDGDETAASQDSGVGGRIRQAARRIRGEKEDGGRTSRPDSGAAKTQSKRTRKKV